MIWSVKCILSCPTRTNFKKSYPFYRQIGFKVFQAKQENKASYTTDYIVPNLIDYFDDGWKEIKILYWLKIGLLLVIYENFLRIIWKNNALNIRIFYWNTNLIHYFQNFLVTEYLRQVNQTHFSYRNYFSIFVLRWDVVKLIKNPFIKIKRQLMLTNFTLFMYKIAEIY